MTRERAFEILDQFQRCTRTECGCAELPITCYECDEAFYTALMALKEPEIVRCKDCYSKLRPGANGVVVCNLDGRQHKEDWYCPNGKRSLTKDD